MAESGISQTASRSKNWSKPASAGYLMDGTLEVLRELGQSILDPIPWLLGLYVDMEIRFEITRSIETACLYTDESLVQRRIP